MANTQAKPELRAVTIAVVRNHPEAQQIQAQLKAAGVESFLIAEPSYALDKSTTQELSAVKVQVRRADVQRALSILGSANLAASRGSGTEATGPKTRNPHARWFEDLNPTVSAIVVVFVILAALILFLS